MTKRSLEQLAETLQRKLYEADRDNDGIPDELEHTRLFPGSDWGGTSDNPVHQINPPGPGGGGGRGTSSAPKVWSRGGQPIAPPASKPAPQVWRKGEAPPKPPEPTIGSQVGKTPKKKLDEPVDLSKEFSQSSKPAPKKSQPDEFSADKKDRMGRKEPTFTQKNEPELRADKRKVVEPSDDGKAPTWIGRAAGAAGTAGALGGAAYLWNKYRDEQLKSEKAAEFKKLYPDAEVKQPEEKLDTLVPADPDNPDYENLKEAKTKSTADYSKKQYIAWAKKYSKLYDVPLSVVLHAMQKETGSYDANTAARVRGPKTKYGQAVGVMQLMPKFFPNLKPEDFTNPEKNIEAGTRELARLYNTYKDPKAALAAYNMGENRDDFREWLKTGDSKLLPKQTREYINGNPKKGTLGYIDNPKAQIAQLDPETTKDKVAQTATNVVAALTGSGSAEAKSKETQKVKVPVHPQLKPIESEFDPSRLQELDPEFATRLKSALDAYGKPLRVTSATRTPIEQTQAFKNWVAGRSPFPASRELASHKGFAIDVDKGDLAKFHQWLQAEKKAGRDYGLETGYEWKNKDPVHLQARDWKTIEKQREFDKYQDQDTKVAQNKPVEKPVTQPTGTYIQPDWSKYAYGELGPLVKDKTGVWKTVDGKQSATDPKLIADLEKLTPIQAPGTSIAAAVTGSKEVKAEPTPVTPKKDVEQSKDVERGKALDKIVRGVMGDLSGASAAEKRDEYYRQQLEKAKQEKAKQDALAASNSEKKADEPVKKVKVKKEKATKKADQQRGGAALASAEREPDTVTIVPAPPSSPPPVADKIDVKDLTKDQAGFAASAPRANKFLEPKIDQHAELAAQKQAEEDQRKQEADRKAAEARAQAEADKQAEQDRAQRELEANRQAAADRAKKAASVQQPVQQTAGLGLKNIWDKGIETLTGKQRVNLRDPRITLPESINTELEEILRLAGKKTKE